MVQLGWAEKFLMYREVPSPQLSPTTHRVIDYKEHRRRRPEKEQALLLGMAKFLFHY